MNYYYQRLGVDPGASASDVKRAYRALARRYHPDVNATPEARQHFLDSTEAYQHILRNLQVSLTESTPDTTAFEQLYQDHPYRARRSTVDPKDTIAPPATIPPVLHFLMGGLVWGMSLFFILIPFFVCYQLLRKGVDGWPSLAFFPLVIGGVCGVYQSARSGKKLLQ